ncbi:DUF1972 domain-containing protein [Variovorax sp. GB1R11]|uniref:DUF1972 domain-containing protein n=1 Tax=Variovorax sp. GB1R11 TaxID=3443741 RepID=UPI003F473004
MQQKTLRILGTRGLPARHGGFETFAESLAEYLVKRGWRVIVYCQEQGSGGIYFDEWNSIERVHIPVKGDGPFGTILFDWLATADAARNSDLCLTLGYNTAIFCTLLRIASVPNVINMDGIEWRRKKWGPAAKLWFWMNDWAGCWLGNHLIADHPEIKKHLSTRVDSKKITTIAYGSAQILDADAHEVQKRGLECGQYLTVIARPEPENSLYEIVSGFSKKNRGLKLAVLGNYEDSDPYHRKVKAAASKEVIFLGAIYDKAAVNALRFYSAAYVHGHQVGGTNPSLVEALGAGNPVIAHDNKFNRWVAGTRAKYFVDDTDFCELLDALSKNPDLLKDMKNESRLRHEVEFTWPSVLSQYEKILMDYLPATSALRAN